MTQEPGVIVQRQESVRVASSLCPPKAAVFVLESDKLPSGGRRAGVYVDQGLSSTVGPLSLSLQFHQWGQLADTSLAGGCRAPGQSVTIIQEKTTDKVPVCCQHLPTYSTPYSVPWSPAKYWVPL